MATTYRTRRELRGQARFRYAPRVEWEEHAAELAEEWAPGQHVSIFAPTDHGKTHLVLHGLAPLWPEAYPWLLIDCKGIDPIMQGWGNTVGKLPSRMWRHRLYDSQRFRLVTPARVERVPASQAQVRAALNTVWNEVGLKKGKDGRAEHMGWVVQFNEVRSLADKDLPNLNLAPYLKAMWQRGRPFITVIAETQTPAWVPREMFDQPSHVYVGGWTDERSVKRAGELGGDTDNIVRIVNQLQKHEFLYFRRRDRRMQIVMAPSV